MRFMMIVKATPNCEAGIMPDKQAMSEMMSYNEQLTKAGALLAVNKLESSSKGARVHYAKGKFKVTDGPFAETKEQLGGIMVLEAADLNYAIQLMSQLPCMRPGGVLEIRSINEELTR